VPRTRPPNQLRIFFAKFSGIAVYILEFVWNYLGNALEILTFATPSLFFTTNPAPAMQAKDFSVFRTLLSDVHNKAFGEPLEKLPHSKAHTLAWLIEDATGISLSYKSLTNYANAVLEECPEKVNPNCATLAALAQFATGEQGGKQMAKLWFRYRAGLLAEA
jgi:hypothetical protein